MNTTKNEIKVSYILNGNPSDKEHRQAVCKAISDAIECNPLFKGRVSAWQRGVKEYALELLEEVSENWGDAPLNTTSELKAMLLNGAKDWKQFSWGGNSLIYDEDIAKRVCTPSELKENKNGSLPPNKYEQWLDVQARALDTASAYIVNHALAFTDLTLD